MATISQNEVRLLIKNSLTVMRDRVDTQSSTMLRHELKVCANRIIELAEMLGNDDKIKVMASMFAVCGVLTPTENIQAVDELFTQKGV